MEDNRFEGLEELIEQNQPASGRQAKILDPEEPSQQRWFSASDSAVKQGVLGEDWADDPSGFIIGENNEANAGMVAHRGVMSEREFELLDWQTAREIALAKLGVSHEQFEFAYSDQAGKPSAAQLAIREHVDDRFLAIQMAGGNMSQLANLLLWDVDPVRGSRKMRRALERAKEARAQRFSF